MLVLQGLFRREIQRAGSVALAVCMLIGAASPQFSLAGTAESILFVDDDASAGGDGLSWATACKTLQDAIEAAQPGSGVSEIRVAQGVYKPDRGGKQIPGDINATFMVPSGVSIRGGYAGLGAKDPDARDFDLYRTTLSGDLKGDDGPPGSFENYNDNSYHIMTLIDTDSKTCVEAVTFFASQADQSGCTLGGGIDCRGGMPRIHHCTFQYNESYGGAGIYLLNSEAEVRECTFIGNYAVGALGDGGGMYIRDGHPTIVDCLFIENSCQYNNGAGALILSNAEFDSCVFISNSAKNDGGGVFCQGGSPVLRCCYFEDNFAGWGGGARTNDLGHPAFIDCVVIRNSAGFEGGGISGGGTLINCYIIGNESENEGGGLHYIYDGEVVNCIIVDNLSLYRSGGGIFVAKGSAPSVSITNSTIARNTSFSGLGGGGSGPAWYDNCILWSNSPQQLEGPLGVAYSCVQGGWLGLGNISDDPMFVSPLGADGLPGTTDDDFSLSSDSPCIDSADRSRLPMDTYDLDDDGIVEEPLPVDILFHTRTLDDPCTKNVTVGTSESFLDMGSYEWRLQGDIDSDGLVNVDDLLEVINAWGECTSGSLECPHDVAPWPYGNGFVNVDDLLVVLNTWRTSCP